MLIAEALSFGQIQLADYTDIALLETQWLLEHLLNRDRLYLLLNGKEPLQPEVETHFLELIRRRQQGEPLQYLIGTQEFMGLSFNVTPAVLIPRRDTECIVEAALNQLSELEGEALHLVDLGAGTGAIGISIAYNEPRAHVTEVELSETAAEVTLQNIEKHLVTKQVRLVRQDMFEFLDGLSASSLDAIVSNPPYIPDEEIDSLQVEVRVHEPRMALAGGNDGLDFYRRIVKDGHRVLKSGGFILFEVGHDQAESVKKLFLDEGAYEAIKCYKDLQGIERAVTAFKK